MRVERISGSCPKRSSRNQRKNKKKNSFSRIKLLFMDCQSLSVLLLIQTRQLFFRGRVGHGRPSRSMFHHASRSQGGYFPSFLTVSDLLLVILPLSQDSLTLKWCRYCENLKTNKTSSDCMIQNLSRFRRNWGYPYSCVVMRTWQSPRLSWRLFYSKVKGGRVDS